jgi:hypothetical protein
MRRRHAALTAALACVLGCGPEVTSVGLALDVSEIPAEVDFVTITFHVETRRCAVLANAPNVRGTFSQEANLSAFQNGLAIEEIRAGRYTVSAVGRQGRDGEPLAFGCIEGVEIVDGVRSEIPLELFKVR